MPRYWLDKILFMSRYSLDSISFMLRYWRDPMVSLVHVTILTSFNLVHVTLLTWFIVHVILLTWFNLVHVTFLTWPNGSSHSCHRAWIGVSISRHSTRVPFQHVPPLRGGRPGGANVVGQTLASSADRWTEVVLNLKKKGDEMEGVNKTRYLN